MMRSLRYALAIVVLAATQAPVARAAERVDLLLALAMDVSRSMSQPKFQLQREGSNNSGRDVRAARDQAVAKGIVINGLAILTDINQAQNPQHTNPPGGLEKYYRDFVIGGEGAFVMVAEDFSSFGRAMVKKLIAEIAGTRLRQHAAATDRNADRR